MEKISLDAFKEMVKTDQKFLDDLVGGADVVDFNNGTAIIHKKNIGKYIEKYMCKSAEDLENTLWYGYGVFVKIVD